MKVTFAIGKHLVEPQHEDTSNNAAEKFFSRISAEVRARAPPPPPPMPSAISFNVDSGACHTDSNNNKAVATSYSSYTPSTGGQVDQPTD
ncbi:unnamed protein product [Taenia asiatica]|uniref:Uncharacterized protein n=1 Tax=Taenia asiatica TaxID=60517 RepID=A0A0R3WEM7_TAEAS|nr:unnamed protein product [Taenia asiatica]